MPASKTLNTRARILGLTLAWLCIRVSILSAQSGLKYPAYEEVVEKLCASYSLPPECSELRLEKRPQGYYVRCYNEVGEPVRWSIFWNKNERRYESLEKILAVTGTELQAETIRSMLLKESKPFAFNTCLYQGYPGWAKETIEALSAYRRDQLPDSLLCGLGRAYNARAMELLNSNYENSDTTHQFRLPKGANALTPAQLAEYCNTELQAVALDSLLWARFPAFRTIVGDTWTEYSDECMTGYTTLRYFQNRDAARRFIRPGLFSEADRFHAYNMLVSCPPNAVLLTWGDTDTYSTLYMQESEGVRKDVTVASLSLLGLGRYINHLRKGSPGGGLLQLSARPDFYERDDYTLFLPDAAKSDTLDWPEWLRQADALQRSWKATAEAYYPAAPSNSIRVYPGGDRQAAPFVYTIENFLYADHLALLDLLATEGKNRPICFAITIVKSGFRQWLPWFESRGLVLAWSGLNKGLSKNGDPVQWAPDQNFNLFAQQFRWLPSNRRKTNLESAAYQLSSAYAIYSLADALLDSSEYQRAAELIEIYLASYHPDVDNFYNQTFLYGQLAQAYQVDRARELCANLIVFLQNTPDLPPWSLDRTAQKIMSIADQYGWKQIRENAEALISDH
jgi:hypothetical protein